MRIADLFSGAGGAAMGLHQAFPDAHIVGFDVRPMPRYPFEHRVQDALTVDLDGFDFVWASPPCQHYIRSGMVKHERHPDLIEPVRDLLTAWGGPWIMENVPGAPLRASVLLCGSMFGLALRRHRLFEASFPLPPFGPASCDHSGPITGVYGHPHGRGGAWRNGKRPMLPSDLPTWSREMGIDWMRGPELAQAIPPEYSRYLARFAPVGVAA